MFSEIRFWIKVLSFMIVFLFFYFIQSNEVKKKLNNYPNINILNKANNIIPYEIENIKQNSYKLLPKKKNHKKKITYKELKEIVRKILKFHWAGLKYSGKLYVKLCNFDISVCRKIKFENINVEKKIKYLAIIQFVIKSLDDNLIYSWNNFKNAIKLIIINWTSNRRWYASHHTIYLNVGNIETNKEFFNVLTHELGHIFDLWILNWHNKIKSRVFTEFSQPMFSIDDPSLEFYEISWLSEKVRKWWQSVKDFVSGYWMTDPFEDFAESFNAYLNHYYYFKYLSYNNYILSMKFDFFDRYFKGFHFFDDKYNLWIVKVKPGRRPWDSTLM